MEAQEYVVWLKQVPDESLARMGSKAANLARLSQAGFPVPDGFCITTEAFSDALDTVDPSDARTELDDSRTDLEQAILASPLPPMIESQVLQAYRLLRRRHGHGAKVAVRSSASAEDLPNASFAGQYVSVLNVAGEDDLLEAIKQCWSSASSAQVQAYQVQRGLCDTRVQMAVLVQVMVQADFAGVLFTVDPMGRDEHHMIVEMTPGLGDDLASGKTMPLHFAINRQTGETILPSHSESQSGIAYLDHIDWKPLFDLSLQSEDLLQSAQDIEWACSNQNFWILQSRAITVHPQQVCRQIWTRANVGEIMPGVISPLTWSIFKPTLQAAGLYRSWSPLTIHWKWQHPCGKWPDSPRLFLGRVYMELASVFASFGNLPGVNVDVLQRMLGFEFHLCRADELPKRRPRWHIMDPYRGTRFWLEMLGITHTLSHQAGRWLHRQESEERADIVTTADVQLDAVLGQVDGLLEEAARILGLHLQCTSMAFSAFGLLDRLIRRYAETEEVQAFEAGLIADFQNISTVQQGIGIWDLAQAAGQVPQVKENLFEIESTDQLIEAWRRCPDAADFVNLWDSFIARFGDRSSQEFELAVAHWDEDPSFVQRMMREILDHQRPDPRERLSQRREAGQRSIRRMAEHIRSRGPYWDAWLFRRLITTYKEYVSIRENLKYCVVSRFNSLRKLFIALGSVLKRRTIIPDCNDVFFLRYNEVVDLINHLSEPPFEGNALVTRRKNKHKEYDGSPAPDVWLSTDGRETPMELPVWRNAETLQGIGCSAGQVTGTACVLTSVQGNTIVAPGQILVAPFTSPGWTPLFLSAAGLVTEIGGMLSHGATVAREYGLPAVVGVPDATKRIQNGQRITVDGFSGLVRLEPTEG